MTVLAEHAPALDLLDRQTRRREEGIPTVCVLRGPVGLGVRRWQDWAARHNIPVARTSNLEWRTVLCNWLGILTQTRDLRADAYVWLGRFSGRNPVELQRRAVAMTVHDFGHFWESLSLTRTRAESAEVCRSLISDPLPSDRLAESLLNAQNANLATLCGLADLVPAHALPALLLMQPPAEEAVHWLAEAARVAEELVSAVPLLPVAIAVEAPLLDALLASAERSRRGALLREGLVTVEGLSESALAERLRRAGIDPVPVAIRRLAAEGISEELADSFLETASHVRSQESPEQEETARSAAERFLFDRLESLAETTGLFALNRRVEFRHGTTNAEIDLLATSLRLAIELDGAHFHLRDAAAYRRDRRKDWELQRRGYLVLRFLSDDVVERLEDILDTIRTAVTLRRGALVQQGGPS